MSSRELLIILSVVALVLTIGGLAGPQIVYAREASVFGDMVKEADTTASQVERAATQLAAEQLMFALRSAEVASAPKRLDKIASGSTEVLSAGFKKMLSAESRQLACALKSPMSLTAVRSKVSFAQEHLADGTLGKLSWFDVETEELIDLVAFDQPEAQRVAGGGTVTLERVQEAKVAIKANGLVRDEIQVELDQMIEANEALTQAVVSVDGLLTKKALLLSATAITTVEASQADEQTALNEDLVNADSALLSAAQHLSAAAQATLYFAGENGVVVSLPQAGEVPADAIRVGEAAALRLMTLIPAFEPFITASDARAKVVEEARVAVEAEAAAAAQESTGTGGSWQGPSDSQAPSPADPTVPPVTPPDGGGEGPDPVEPEPGPEPDPEPSPGPDDGGAPVGE